MKNKERRDPTEPQLALNVSEMNFEGKDVVMQAIQQSQSVISDLSREAKIKKQKENTPKKPVYSHPSWYEQLQINNTNMVINMQSGMKSYPWMTSPQPYPPVKQEIKQEPVLVSPSPAVNDQNIVVTNAVFVENASSEPDQISVTPQKVAQEEKPSSHKKRKNSYDSKTSKEKKQKKSPKKASNRKRSSSESMENEIHAAKTLLNISNTSSSSSSSSMERASGGGTSKKVKKTNEAAAAVTIKKEPFVPCENTPIQKESRVVSRPKKAENTNKNNKKQIKDQPEKKIKKEYVDPNCKINPFEMQDENPFF